MSQVTYIQPDGSATTVDVSEGVSVMRAAITEGVDGIIGECGGQAMCATCHVYVEQSDATLPEISEDEEEMLECTAAPCTETSRLSCQLRAGADFTKLTVRLPESQV